MQMKKTIEGYKDRMTGITKDLRSFFGSKKGAISKKTNADVFVNLTEDQDLTIEQLQILEKLTKSNSTKERVKLFGKIMDTYGVDPLLSLIPLGDIPINTIATIYLLAEGIKMGLSFGDMLKIFGYQSADTAIGSIRLFGSIVDFFFKGNKWSAKIFEKHFEKLKQEAIKKGINPKDIENIESKNKEFLNKINKHLDSKNKK